MTAGNRRTNIDDSLARAGDALRAAKSLAGLGLHADAVSRAYYAAYHFLRALLFARGIEPKTHAGAIHLFNTEFVRPSLFPTSCNRVLTGMQRARELSDYDAAVRFGAEDAAAEIRAAEEFGDAVRQWLAANAAPAPAAP